MYNAFQIVLSVVAIGLIIVLVRKNNVNRKKLITPLLIGLCVLVISLTSIFPIENTFMTFDTPESVFDYMNLGEIHTVIYGEDSCMIVYFEDASTYGYLYIPKDDDGYKIPNYYSTTIVYSELDAHNYFKVKRVIGTDDYYITGSSLSSEEPLIIDFNNREVPHYLLSTVGEYSFIFYGYIEDYTDAYFITINDRRFDLYN